MNQSQNNTTEQQCVIVFSMPFDILREELKLDEEFVEKQWRRHSSRMCSDHVIYTGLRAMHPPAGIKLLSTGRSPFMKSTRSLNSGKLIINDTHRTSVSLNRA
ncbi:uncharacterized protein LOC105735534 [Apis florea]|uniref:uncharacterized protein LOC105735534 n=1 Tax=Apis florea TaxID=7463 RepID=UPI000628FD1E|nr:uncharacterized protein LOC105735534 [Apis florea]